MTNKKYAVMFHRVNEPAWYMELIDISKDIDMASHVMFDDFDDRFCGNKYMCLCANTDMELNNGIIYFVVDLNHIPVKEDTGNIDFGKLDRYYVFAKEED